MYKFYKMFNRAKQLQINKDSSALKSLKESHAGLQLQYDELKEKYEQLSQEKKILEEKIKNYEMEIKTENTLRYEIIEKLRKNHTREPHGHRFTENIYKFSQLIYNISPKCYEIIKDILIFPSLSQLSEFYSEDTHFYTECIQNIDAIPLLIEKYREIYQITDQIECVLSIDAASLDRPYQSKFSYAFVFHLQPLNPDLKCIPLHIYPKSNGSANKEIIQISEEICNILK